MSSDVNPYAVFVAERAKYRTSEQFAMAMGISQPYVSLITNHLRPIPERVLKKLGIMRVVTITYHWADRPDE